MSLFKFLPGRSASSADAMTAPAAPPPPPYLLRYRSSTVFIVSTVCVATFTDIFLYGLIVPVMPFALTERAGVAADQVQRWNTILMACYGIALFVASPVAGTFADHTSSRRSPLMGGLVALAASTLLLCLGRSIGVFVVGRILQGFSAAVVWSVGLALLADTMGRRIGLAMGYVSISISAGLLFAPLIGGATYAGAGYYAVYYVAFGFIGLDVLLRILMVEKKTALQWLKEEGVEVDAALPTDDTEAQPTTPVTPPPTSTGTHTTTTTNAPTNTPTTASTCKRIAILLRSQRLLANLAGCVVTAGIYTAFDTVLPLFTQEAFGWNSTAAGLLFFTLYTPPLVLSPPVGILADRYGAKWPAVFGFLLSVPLLVCLRLVDHNTLHQKVLLGALLSLLGAALTFSQVPLMAEISFVIETEEQSHPGVWGAKGVYGIGYGLYTTAFALGSSAGSLMTGYVHESYSWSAATWALAVWSSVGFVTSLAGVGDFRLHAPPKPKGPPVLSREFLAPADEKRSLPQQQQQQQQQQEMHK